MSATRCYRQITCEVCGHLRITQLRNRDICRKCRDREESTACVGCGAVRYQVSKDTGLCPQCAGIFGRPIGANCRQIICEVCSHLRRTNLRNRNICHKCYSREQSTRCKACGAIKHQVSEETGLCPQCASIVARPITTCSHCLRSTNIFNQETWLCKTCNILLRQRSYSQAKKVKVECSVCGKVCSSIRLNRAICRSCYEKERHGLQLCVKCNKPSVIFYKAGQLCCSCNLDRLAFKALDDFVIKFTTPYSYNKTLFDLLVTTIDWKSVKNETNRRFRYFGHFLQTYQLPKPLTWEAIEEALPELVPTSRPRPARVRSCLLDLGHLLAAKNQLESREIYVARRNVLQPITTAPGLIQPFLNSYAVWLGERRMRLDGVRQHLYVLASFWLWAAQHGIKLLEEVQSSLIDDYLQTLYWQWQCAVCQSEMAFEPRDRHVPKICVHCHTTRSLAKVRRYAQNTVRHHNSILSVFFDWAKNSRLTLIDPVYKKIALPEQAIHHYSQEVISQCSKYITTPEADPIEALTLYLIIFHAFTVWELQHTQIPIVFPVHQGISVPPLAETYYLVVPMLAPSRGNHLPGRPSNRLDFPPNAAPWLKPLLSRFECQRQQRLRTLSNRYLFISSSRIRHNTPASPEFIRRTVRSASLHATGAVCTPKGLRATSATMYVDHFGGGILEWMGWGEQRAFFYSWGPRVVIHPQPLDTSQDTELQLSLEPTGFPSVKGN